MTVVRTGYSFPCGAFQKDSIIERFLLDKKRYVIHLSFCYFFLIIIDEIYGLSTLSVSSYPSIQIN